MPNDIPLNLRPRKAAGLVAQRIVADIIESGHAPGTRLSPESVMLAEYEVGRGTLREALRLLEMQGVLTIRPGPRGGPTVVGTDSRALASNLALLLSIERTPFRAILEVRQTLEPTLAARSALSAGDEGLAELAESVEAMSAHAGDQRRFVLENRRFHDLIGVRAGNPVFAHLVTALNWIIDGTALGVHFREAHVRAAAEAHRRICTATGDRDADGAHAAMAEHLSEFVAYLEDRYPETLDFPLRWEGAL